MIQCFEDQQTGRRFQVTLEVNGTASVRYTPVNGQGVRIAMNHEPVPDDLCAVAARQIANEEAATFADRLGRRVTDDEWRSMGCRARARLTLIGDAAGR